MKTTYTYMLELSREELSVLVRWAAEARRSRSQAKIEWKELEAKMEEALLNLWDPEEDHA